MATLSDKKEYCTMLSNLKLYMRIGVKLVKIHKILKFKQAPIFEPYITYNNDKRAKSTSILEKNDIKLFVNSIYGKLIENLHKRFNFDLIRLDNKCANYSPDYYYRQPTIEDVVFFNPKLLGLKRRKAIVRQRASIFQGFSVLERSKHRMVQFFYEKLQPLFGIENVTVLATDTDSLILAIYRKNAWEILQQIGEEMDFSNFEKDQPYGHLRSDTNKGISGKFKSETGNIHIQSFVGIRAKCYSLQLADGSTKNTCKGVEKRIARNYKHELYKRVLFDDQTVYVETRRIRSHLHEIYIQLEKKISLTPFDDKRALLTKILSVPYGHYCLD